MVEIDSIEDALEQGKIPYKNYVCYKYDNLIFWEERDVRNGIIYGVDYYATLDGVVQKLESYFVNVLLDRKDYWKSINLSKYYLNGVGNFEKSLSQEEMLKILVPRLFSSFKKIETVNNLLFKVTSYYGYSEQYYVVCSNKLFQIDSFELEDFGKITDIAKVVEDFIVDNFLALHQGVYSDGFCKKTIRISGSSYERIFMPNTSFGTEEYDNCKYKLEESYNEVDLARKKNCKGSNKVYNF